MSARVIKKKIKIPEGMANEDLAEMFNQMLGAGSVNMGIAYPRYKKIHERLDKLITLFEMFINSPVMKSYPDLAENAAEIAEFCRKSRATLPEYKIDLSAYEWNINLVEEPERKKFAEVYESLKKSDIVNHFIVTCDRLVIYKRYIGDESTINHSFITTESCPQICPFPFTGLDIKYMFSLGLSERTKKFIALVLHKAFDFSYQLYHDITSPDINVDEFVNIIISNISDAQKQPGLSRCNKAFKKITDSVSLLKGNFTEYYRDFIQTKNSTIILENFILDVSKKTTADPETTAQFRRIITHYRKLAREQINNPKVKMLFDKVNESFEALERGTSNLVNVRNQDAEDDNSDDSGHDSDEETSKTESQQHEHAARMASAEKTVDELVAEINKVGKKNTKK